MQCFVFHLYKGVRAGGGIGDEIESPDGDPNEVYRILFDISFFFFIIIILLAIIQGKSTHAHITQSSDDVSDVTSWHFRFDYRRFWGTEKSVGASERRP